MSAEELTILINAEHGPELLGQIAEIAPAARILTREDFRGDPSLIEAVDVVFGGVRRELLPRAGRLKWIQARGAGADWSKCEEVRAHPAVICNVHIHPTAISEHLFGMLLMLTRGLHVSRDYQSERRWECPPPPSCDVLAGKTLCVVGLGAIGRRCAMLGEAFGMTVIGVRRRPRPTPHADEVYGPDGLLDAVARSEVVMNVLPGTPRTYRMIGRDAFAAMPTGAFFLNAGRGRTVDTDALVEALRSGRLGGAALDVVDPEPLPPDHPLWAMPNVLISSHYSGGFPEYSRAAEAVFLDNLRRFVASEPLDNVIDKQEGY